MNDIKKMLRKEVLELQEYTPTPSFEDLGEEYLKLDICESTYGFSPKVSKVLGNYKFYNYYPDPDYKKLRKALAKYSEVGIENIVAGSGSDELLGLIFKLVLNPGDKVINTPPSFGMYPVLVTLSSGVIVDVPRKKDFSLDIKSIKENLDTDTKIIIVCSPNNPTGNTTSEKEIIELLESEKIVILDEAYVEFASGSRANLLKDYPNLIILRTLSKWAGLAGLRVGYALASPILVKEILKIKTPFNVNSAGDLAARAALEDLPFYKDILKKVVSERERVYRQLAEIPLLDVFPSESNSLFIRVKKGFAKLKTYLESKKIAVRYFDSLLTEQAIRLTIGTPVQNDKVLKTLKEFKG